jgi:hypothetical protein
MQSSRTDRTVCLPLALSHLLGQPVRFWGIPEHRGCNYLSMVLASAEPVVTVMLPAKA